MAVDMKAAETFAIDLENPIKSIALNRDGSQVVAAGRNLLRILNIEDNRFVEKENLRFPNKRSNWNCASSDIVWNHVDESILASATTTGAVCLWNLSTPGNLVMTFSEQKRTVNRIAFHPSDASSLLSGSQDATIVLYDLRKQEKAMVYGCEEAVRDVRFNPHQNNQFAVCLENGNVKIFDMRKADTSERELTCHTGPVFQCDFHPSDRNLLATCGRGRCIKVWDMQDSGKSPTLQHVIPTIAHMGVIAWRPQRETYIAGTALTTDFSVNVWDLRRPYIPFASFEKHVKVVTTLMWRMDPHILMTGSQDGCLTHFTFQDAKRPADHVNPVGLDIGCYGDVAHACSQRIMDGYGHHGHHDKRGKKLASIFAESTSAAEDFPLNAVSSLSTFPHDSLKSLSMDWFVHSAKNYLLFGRSVSEMCTHNAAVAEKVGRIQVAQVWRIVGYLHAFSEGRAQKSGHSSGDNRIIHRYDSRGGTTYQNRKEDGLMQPQMPEGNLHDTTFQRSSRHPSAKDPPSGMMEPQSSNTGDFLFNEQTVFEEVDSPFVVAEPVDEESFHTLPTEGFQLRHELPDRAHACLTHDVEVVPGGRATTNANRNRIRSGSIGPDSETEDSLRLASLMPQVSGSSFLDFSDLVQESIQYHAEQGDVQTAVSLIIVLGDRIKGFFDEVLLEAYVLDYIDLLTRFQLYTVANEVIKLSQVSAVSELNQQSTTIHTSCNMCAKHLHSNGWYCTSCRKLTNCCSICQLPVRGLYVWCQGCSHGGHLDHVLEWMKKSSQCPTGCGHFLLM
ncbi:hypothetical protein RvY_08990-2 [Ramazzottius varieornatus]|uniref:GATOR2 complex protein WDR24 n=1 Tax=Ramazzottius varieornatus TaxID=947166 RepID=A0A1D1V7S3_RAMVA|nr:hypothetical protein RvY_08990-2 [Ramazzottius varieornatus]